MASVEPAQTKRADYPPPSSSPTGRAPPLVKPIVGDTLAVMAGIALLLVGMMLPLVGRAGVAAPHAMENRRAFGAALLCALGLSLAAAGVKWRRHRRAGDPPPWATTALALLCFFLWLALISGALGR